MKNKIIFLLAMYYFLPTWAFQPVDLNQASLKQIALLPGVGEKQAQRIFDLRKSMGAISHKNQLRLAKLSPKKIAALSPLITFKKKPSKQLGEEKNKINSQAIALNKNSLKVPQPGPSLQEIWHQAKCHEHLLESQEIIWFRRAKRSAWLPEFSIYFDFDKISGNNERRRVRDENTCYEREGQDVGVGLKAKWNLANTIFNQAELETAKVSLKRQSARDKLRKIIIEKYFLKQKLIAELRKNSTAQIDSNIDQISAIDQILNLLTDGWYLRSLRNLPAKNNAKKC
jgi:hypothetical protein